MSPNAPARQVRKSSALLLFSCAALGVGPNLTLAAPISENTALERASAMPELQARDAASQDAAAAQAQAVVRFGDPELSFGQDRLSGALGTQTERFLEMRQPLGLNGASRSLRASADAEALAVAEDIRWQQAGRRRDTRKAFAICAAAEERSAVLTRQAERLKAIERSIALRTRAGDAAGYDLRRIQLEIRSLDGTILIAGGEIEASCSLMSRLTGEPDARALDSLASLLASESPTEANQNERPDLRAQRLRLDAIKSQAQVAKRQQSPDVDLSLGYREVTDGGLSARGATLAFSVTVPLFSGDHARRAADARLREARADLAINSATINADRHAAAVRARTTNAAARLALGSIDEARRVIEIAEAAYHGGEADITELIDGYQAGTESHLQAIELAERALLARADHLLNTEGDEP